MVYLPETTLEGVDVELALVTRVQSLPQSLYPGILGVLRLPLHGVDCSLLSVRHGGAGVA